MARWLTLTALILSAGAQAQSASNGQTLYNSVIVSGQNSCSASACHGSAPSRRINRIQLGVSAATIKSGVASVGQMNFLSGHLSDSDYNDLAAYIASSAGGTASYLTVAAAPALSASSVAFGSVTVGNSSALRGITLTNSGTAALAISSITSSNAVFGLTHNCPISPGTLAVGSACTLTLTFTPSVAGAVSGSLTIGSNATPASQTVSLSGTGAAAAVALLAWSGSPGSLTLASSTVGTLGTAQTLTLLNQGSASATLSAISLSGNNPGDFALGGSCVVGATLAGNGSCTVTVALDPTSAGGKSATLQVSSGNASNPTPISLSGSATVAPSSGGAGTTTGSGSTVSTSGLNANAGGGGCSMVDPQRVATRKADPMLLVLTALAACVLLWRRLPWRGISR